MAEILSQLENGLGLEIILWFQAWRTPVVEAFFKSITFTGTSIFFVLVLPIVYWCYDTTIGRRVILLFLLSAWLTQWFKEWWGRPRPPAVSTRIQAAVDEPDYGLPSGHALVTTVLWGAIAWYIRRWWVTVLIVTYVSLVALSRMVLGVHFPQDVIAGLVIGLTILVVYVWLEPGLSAWLSKQGFWAQIGWVVATSALLLTVHPLLFPDNSGYGLGRAVIPVGVLLGSGIGFVLEAHYLCIDAGGHWGKRVLRYLLGTIVLLVMFVGLEVAFDQLRPAHLFTFIQFGAIGLWVGYGAPWTFVKTGLVVAHIRRPHREPYQS